MRKNGKGIKIENIYALSNCLIGNIKYDYRVIMKNKKEIKLKHCVGKKLFKLYNEYHEVE